MCNTIAINAKLPRARLIINRVTVRINAAREKFRDNFADYIGNRDGVSCPLQLETASEEFLPTKDNRSL